MRLLALMLAAWLAVGATASSAAAPPRDFIADMMVRLAVDPAGASDVADAQIARTRAAATRGDTAGAAAAHWVKAQAQFRLGDNAAASQTLVTAKRLAPAGAAGNRIRAYIDLLEGLLARGDGDFADALTRLRRAQQGFIAAGDRRGQALALQSVGVLYNDASNGAEALRYLALAQESYAGDDVFLLSLNNNFAVAYQTEERFAEAEARLRAARGYARKLGISGFSQQITLNIAASQVAVGRFDAAAVSLAEFDAEAGSGNSPLRGEADVLRAQVALGQDRLSDALRYIDHVLEGVDPQTSDRSFHKAHFVAYQVYFAAGRYQAAVEQLEATRRLEAVYARLASTNRAALLAAQFQFDAQDAQIAQLKAENLEREVSFQRTMTVTIVIGALLALGLLAGLLITAIRARNRARRDSAELSVVNQRLEQALAAKTEFLASTSHELRTPLNGILGMTQILLADAAVAPRHRTQIELLHDAGSTMRALVDDILDVAKIEHGGFTISPKPTDVAELAERVTRLFTAQADSAGLALDCTVDLPHPCGLVDPDRLTQILFNLVGNALKFTPDGGIAVSVSEAAAQDEAGLPSLVLSVRDSGIGIAPEWHDSVFDMFRQVDGARTRNYGGTGLGLAICRQLARAMGGDIALASAPGEGSTFTVTLPWETIETAQSNVVSLGSRPDFAADGAIDADAVVIVAADPMRTAMLSAIVRRAGLVASIADTGERIEAALRSKCLTLLVDASAWPLVGSMTAAEAAARHNIIIVGDRDGEGEMGQAVDSVPRVVAFSRNAIAAALADISRGGGDSSLPDRADDGIARRTKGLEPKRSAPMSRK